MNWKTNIEFQSDINISYQDSIFSIGSCFSENMGQLLEKHKFDILINPFGILYHPLNIVKTIKLIIELDEWKPEDLFYYNDLWQSWYHHGSYSSLEKEETLFKINSSLKKAKQHLKSSKIVFITLGSAWAYYLKENQQLVANCHKYPSTNFNKHKSNSQEIIESFQTLISKYLKDKTIIFTLSPVRHIRDGIIENQRSKAELILSIESLCNHNENVHYFPAYEIVLDELRDYRFYSKDLVHPNELAIEYIWNRFREIYFDTKTSQQYEAISKFIKNMNHKILHEGTKNHFQFLQSLESKANNLEKQYGISLKEELQSITQQLQLFK